MTLKIKVKVIWNQWHLKTIEWAISDSLWICESNRRSICNFTRPWLYLLLPICINCRALAWEGVFVYKLAFFFWLSHRTYHFLFKKTTDNRFAVLLTKYRTVVDFRTVARRICDVIISPPDTHSATNRRIMLRNVFVHYLMNRSFMASLASFCGLFF